MSKERTPDHGSGPVVDLFKLIKFQNVKPIALEESPPQSWSEVWGRFNRSLMRITAGIPTFMAEAIEGVTRAIRGATLPEKTEQAVFLAHAEADMREEQLQRQTAKGKPGSAEGISHEAEEELLSILQRYQTQGYKIAFEKRPDGSFVVAIVRPGLEDIAKDAIQELPERALIEDKPISR